MAAPALAPLPAASAVLMALLLAACGSVPTLPGRSAPEESTAPASGSGSTPGASTSPDTAVEASAGTVSGPAPTPPPQLPARALQEYERALGLMRAGNAGEAELEFKQLSLSYPQLVGAPINLALLQRKANRLEEAEATLQAAVEKNPTSAAAWNELGLTQRMRGRFQEAAASYQQAIAADPGFAAAYRNYAVLLDLYLGDPEQALTAFEKYKELTGEDKPVSGWIAELRQRTGKPAAPRPAATPAPVESEPAEGAPSDAAPADAAPGENAPADSSAPQPAAASEPARAGAVVSASTARGA